MAGSARMTSAKLLLFLIPACLAAQSHAGKPVPEFVNGDECLFCHRNNIGPNWQKNAHGTTVRPREESTTDFKLGGRNHTRQLKKDGYNKFAIYDTAKKGWDSSAFTENCTGCHNTGIDSKTGSFSSFGIDCYACHGVVDLNHSNDTSLVWLSKKNKTDAKAVAATCAQCHLRESAKSKSTGKPWPDNFVIGDNLWDDYQADLSRAADPTLNAGDRHVYRNVRDVTESGSEVTCISCHSVHGNSSAKHRRVLTSTACLDCHNAEGPKKVIKKYAAVSRTCDLTAPQP